MKLPSGPPQKQPEIQNCTVNSDGRARSPPWAAWSRRMALFPFCLWWPLSKVPQPQNLGGRASLGCSWTGPPAIHMPVPRLQSSTISALGIKIQKAATFRFIVEKIAPMFTELGTDHKEVGSCGLVICFHSWPSQSFSLKSLFDR